MYALQDQDERWEDVNQANILTCSCVVVVCEQPAYGVKEPDEYTRQSWDTATRSVLAEGPVLLLALRRVHATSVLRTAVGPIRNVTARSEAPDSIRAMFGTDDLQLAMLTVRWGGSCACAYRALCSLKPRPAPPFHR